MQNDKIVVQKACFPFNRFETLELEKSKTLQEIVDKTVPFNFKDYNLALVVNGNVVTSDRWQDYKLVKGDIVGINFIPTGGGGGGKNTVMMIAMIAAVAFMPALAGTMGTWGALAGEAIGAYVGGTTSAMFIGGAIGYGLGYGLGLVVGSMLLTMAQNALMSTPKQQASNTSLAESPTSFIEGASNAINKYGIVPVNLGTNRMFPSQAALSYTETIGNNQYARQLFTYGYGKLVISDRRIGETELTQFKEIEYEDRLDADLNQGTNLYANDVYQESLNINITKEAGYILRTTQTNADECDLEINFQGLCKFRDDGGKDNTSVTFEIQYAPTGTQNWSVGAAGFEVINPQTLTEDLSNTFINAKKSKHWATTDTFIILNMNSGGVYTKQTKNQIRFGVAWPSLSNDDVVLGYIRGEWPGSGGFLNNQPASTLKYVDNRASLVGKYINSINDFVVTVDLSDKSNVEINVGTGTIKGVAGQLTITDATSQALRKNKRIQFPQRGQYDVRIRRLTDDSTDDKLINASYLTALKTITYQKPVKFANISGTAIRIKATDQLNGSINSYNCIVSTLLKTYDADSDSWVDDQISSNPADIFRYVLQSPAFAKRLNDDQIDLEKLKEWSIYCDANSLTYNRIIDYETSIDDVLNDICAAGVATLSKVNNIYSVVIDNERPIVKGIVTPRNSWEYSGNINYPDIPHALRIEFRNEDKGFETDERIVYADGYDENTATLYERLQFSSCTDADLAYWYGRRYFATALLQPETHTFKMDFESMTFERGDRITLVNDVILVGVGQGRIKNLMVNDVNNPTQVMGFTIDDEVNIPNTNKFGVRIRDNKGSSNTTYHLLKTVEGVTNNFEFDEPIEYSNAPAIGSLCAFVEDGKELDLIITQIKPGNDYSATITAIDYAPARFDPLGEIPPFESNITISSDFYKPYPPELAGTIQTDESVMIRNSDGSLTSVMVIPLLNRNEPSILPIVSVRRAGATEWFTPTAVKKDPNQLILTGLQDGIHYDIEIRYQRPSGLQLLSEPLTLTNIKFIGGSNPPKKVQNFRLTVISGMALFEWAPNDDIDISHYVIRYSTNVDNLTWAGAQVVMDKITSTSITNVVHKGAYLIKAVDMLGNESLEPTVIYSDETGTFKNVVEELIQDPYWLGVKDNVLGSTDGITLDINDLEGYYYFDPDVLDLGEKFECSLTANIISSVTKRDKVRDIPVVRDVPSIRAWGSSLTTDGDWGVDLQMNLSEDGENWTGWTTFTAARQVFRAAKFRLRIWASNSNITPSVTVARVTIDMPDRYETGEDIVINDAMQGAEVIYSNPFRNNPSVNITLQDGAIDDKIEYIKKDSIGFTIKVFNGSLNTYVTRSFDYLSAGYGKVLS